MKSNVSFQVKKMGFLNVKGSLNDFQGTVSFDPTDLANSSFNLCVSVKTINTGNPKRDEHLKSEDFFQVEQHPNICFTSTNIKNTGDQYLVLGSLTILNQSRTIQIPFQVDQGHFRGQFSINRQDFELGKKFPGFIVGKTVQVSIDYIEQ